MPENYTKIQLGQLLSAIWSKYLQLQGGDVATQRQLLEKDKEIFQKEKELQGLKIVIEKSKSNNKTTELYDEFKAMVESGAIKDFTASRKTILSGGVIEPAHVRNISEAMAFGLVQENPRNINYVIITDKGKEFFKWFILNSNFDDKSQVQ